MTSTLTDTIRATVERYVALVATGTAQELADLYTADAVVEDPVGTEPKVRHAAIRDFYEVLQAAQRETKLLTARIAGKQAAFHFELTTTFGEQKVVLAPIDVMEFDDDGRVTSMKAYWGQDDLKLT
ncbi:nuclear transport factor 2 family protein [Antrihabitans spumae]|uniref:Nuclear transport factor 2 family protein n=1 Tax=Antrihabitans spumae TaxID=3373370 RepID=A0ABW7KPX0_9NOCA